MARINLQAIVGAKDVRAYSRPRLGGRTSDAMSAREGMRNVLSNYRKVVAALEGSTAAILVDALRPTFEKSQDYVPVKYGTLRDSGYLQARGMTVEIGYGMGGQPDYAVAVHENLEARHAAPRRAKFLQAALEEDASEIQTRIENGYRGMLR